MTKAYLSKKLMIADGNRILLADGSSSLASRSHFQEIIHDIRALVASEWKLVDGFISKPFLASQLVVGIEDELLVDLLGPDLLSSLIPSGSFSIQTLTALLYINEYLSIVQSPLLLRSLSNFVFGRDSEPEVNRTTTQIQTQTIKDLMFDCLLSTCKELVLLTLQVFDGFIKTLDPEIIFLLLGRNTRLLSFLLRAPLSLPLTDLGLRFTIPPPSPESILTLEPIDKSCLVHASMIEFVFPPLYLELSLSLSDRKVDKQLS